MARIPVRLVAVVVAGLAAIAVWSLVEVRAQRREVAALAAAQAEALGRALGMSIAAADAATLEIDELLRWKLLDDARFFAALLAGGPVRPERLSDLADDTGLDSVVALDSRCERELWLFGDLPEAERRDVLAALRPLCRGEADTLVSGAGAGEHLLVAAREAGGPVVAVRAHRDAVQAFSAITGVPRLLEALVGSGDVVYLVWEENGAPVFSATWDGGELPPRADDEPASRTVRGRAVIEARTPVAVPGARSAALRVGLDATRVARLARRAMTRSLLAGVGFALAGVAALAFAVVQRARAAEREQAARRLAEAEAARQRSERLAAAGALSAGLAHEVRSPLNAIALAAQRMRRRPVGGEECARFAERIEAEVRRLDEALHGFLELARPVADERGPVDLRALAGSVAELLSAEAAPRDVAIDVSGEAVVVTADEAALRRALLNVVRNAIQASPDGGRVAVEIEAREGRAVVRVLDEGPGFGDELIDRACDAFVTTRADGTGLGLALARRVLEEHGGELRLADRRPRGAEVSLVLPHGEGDSR